MSQTREEAHWRSGKSEIIGKYRQDHEKLFSVVAARGFTTLPGFAYDTENRLELAAKLNLSELNLKIITETVEREIKQTGLDYDIAYRAAAIAWEIDKQSLLDAWQREYSSIKANMAAAEEVLDRMMIEVKARGTYLIEQKTTLELQTEDLKQQLAALDSATAAYEVTLANAKLATAQKKLDLIPILLAIVEKEEELVEAEQGKAEEYAKLIAAEEEVIDKKEAVLVPALGELLNATERYADELPTQIDLEKDISDQKVLQAGISVEISGLKSDIAEIGVDIEEENLKQAIAKKNLQEEKDGSEREIAERQLEHVQELSTEEQSANTELLNEARQTHDYVLDKKESTIDKRLDTEKVSSGRLTTAEKETSQDIASNEAYTMREKATIDAAKRLSAELTHLIG